jgi:hypothetical protein
MYINREEPMTIRVAVFALVVVAAVSCTSSPRYMGGEASFAGPELGVTTDEKFKVIQIEPGSAAEAAGVQVGDVLVDLTWIPTEAPASSSQVTDVVALATPVIEVVEGVTEVVGYVVPAQTVPVESYIEKGTVPFTDSGRIRGLTGYRGPLKLTLRRGDQVLELTITPTPRVGHPLAPGEPTATPVMPPYRYF